MSDITINRNKGNAASKIANDVVEPTKGAIVEIVIDYIHRYPQGKTSEDVAEYLQFVKPRNGGWPANCVSPRITEAKGEFYLGTEIPRGDRRIMACGLRKSRQILVRYEAQMSLLEAR